MLCRTTSSGKPDLPGEVPQLNPWFKPMICDGTLEGVSLIYLLDLLDVKSEVDDIAILNNIFLPFQPPFPGFFCTIFTIASNKVIIGD